MKIEFIVGFVVGALFVSFFGRLIYKRIPRRLKTNYFTYKWKQMQQLCKDKQTWPQALLAADKLLDEALKKRRFKGKSMGERMVAAQRKISNNDALWFAHNLVKKSIEDSQMKLREKDVKQALMGIRQALKDLGAFEPDKPMPENESQKL